MVRILGAALCAVLLLAGCGSSQPSRETLAQLLGISMKGRYRTPGGSMEPTLRIGEHFEAHPGAPAVGEIVVFHPPEGAEEQLCGQHGTVRPGGRPCAVTGSHEDHSTTFVKRIVAGPGDRLYIHDGHVYREPAGTHGFVREPDRYIKPCAANAPCDFPVPIAVPAGTWYLLGDNRGESDDSRFWGPIPGAWISGVVSLTR
jgi:signal peptidase I